MKKIFTLSILIASLSFKSQAQDTLVRTDMSWVYSNTEEPGWQQPGFDDSAWSQVIKLDSNCTPVCKIGGDHFGDVTQVPYAAYLRSKFFVDYQPSLALMNTGEDDDVRIYINGNLVFIDSNHLAGEYFDIDVTSFIIPYDSNTIAVKQIDWYCCFYGLLLLIHTPDSIFDMPGFASSASKVCEKFCINFYDSPFNNATTWQWYFPGGDPSSSADQNPTNVCYNSPGVYDVTLITTSANGIDTFYKLNYITVNPTPPLPVITQVGNTLTSSVADFYQWQFNTVDIPGATGQSYDAAQTGYYTVVTSDMNDCVSSTTLYAEITGIENLSSGKTIFISPNPIHDQANIQFNLPRSSHVTVKVCDMTGKEIITLLNDQLLPGEHSLQLNTSEFSKGIYLVKMISDFGME